MNESPLDKIAASLANIAVSLALIERHLRPEEKRRPPAGYDPETDDPRLSSARAPAPADSPTRRSLTPAGVVLDFRDLGDPAKVNAACAARASTITAPTGRGLGDVEPAAAVPWSKWRSATDQSDFPPLDTMKGDLSDPIDPWGPAI